MAALQTVNESSQIDSEKLHGIMKIMFDSFIVNGDYKNQSNVLEKEKMLDSFSSFIQQYLNLNLSGSKDEKLRLMKLVAKLNMQKDLLELANGETKLEDIQSAGKRLGKKSQSAFETK